MKSNLLSRLLAETVSVGFIISDISIDELGAELNTFPKDIFNVRIVPDVRDDLQQFYKHSYDTFVGFVAISKLNASNDPVEFDAQIYSNFEKPDYLPQLITILNTLLLR